MQDSTTKKLNFSSLGRKKIYGPFSSGDITSDGGLILLRELDRELGLSKAIAVYKR